MNFMLPKTVINLEYLPGHANTSIVQSDIDNICNLLKVRSDNLTIITDGLACLSTLEKAERLSVRVGKQQTSTYSIGVPKELYNAPLSIACQLYSYNGLTFVKYMKLGGSYGENIYYAAPRGMLSKILLTAKRQMNRTMFLEDKVKSIIKDRVIRYHALIKTNCNLPNSGIIFYGPPGNGKSLIVQHLLGKRKLNPHLVSARELGDRDIREYSEPAVYIFDDTDITYFNREGSGSAIASYLLSFMDGKTKNPHAFILTTNEDVGTIDRAFLRPGRFNMVVKIDNPSKVLREQFIKSWNFNIDVDKLVKVSDGWSFAEIEFIKTCLVMQQFENKPLDLDQAITDFNTRKEEERKYMGFRA